MSEISKVVFLCTIPLTNKVYKDYGLKYLEKRHDVQAWLLENYYKDVDDISDGMYKGSNYKVFRSPKKLRKAMVDNRENAMFLLPYESQDFYWKVLNKNHLTYCSYGAITSTLPTDPSKELKDRCMRHERGLRHLFLKFMKMGIRVAAQKARNRIVNAGSSRQQTMLSNPPHAFFYSDKDRIPNEVDEKSKVYVPSHCYNEYLEIGIKDREESQYILLLDSGLGFRTWGLEPRDYTESIYQGDNKNKFMSQIESVLDRLEEQYQVPVKIAVHPHINYEGYTFGGRDMIVGNSAELAAGSEFLIYRAPSTVVSYAALWKKDILLLYNNTVKAEASWNFVYLPLMRELHITGLNLDEEYDPHRLCDYVEHIKQEDYETYFNKYISYGVRTNNTVGETMERIIFPNDG